MKQFSLLSECGQKDKILSSHLNLFCCFFQVACICGQRCNSFQTDVADGTLSCGWSDPNERLQRPGHYGGWSATDAANGAPRPGWDHTTAADTAGAGTPEPTILHLLFSSPWVGSHYPCWYRWRRYTGTYHSSIAILLALGGITLPLLILLAQVHRYLPFFSSYSPRPGWDHTTAADTAGAGTPVPTILQFLFSGQCNFCPLRSPELWQCADQ